MKKRALLIAYYYFPNTAVGAKRPTQLAKALEADGWTVDTLTKKLDPLSERLRKSSHTDGQVIPVYQHPGIVNPLWKWLKKIRRSKSSLDLPIGKNEAIERPLHRSDVLERRSFSFRRFIFSLQSIFSETKSWVALSLIYILALKAKGKKYDLIVSTSPPDSAHFLGLVSKKLFNAPLIIDLRDPLIMWDEVDPETVTSFRKKFEEKMESKYYRKSDHIVVTSPSLERELVELHGVPETKVTTIYNGFDGKLELSSVSETLPIKGIFAGNLYFKRNPFPLFEAVKILKEKGQISSSELKLDFFGDCDYWNGIDLKAWLQESGIADIVAIKGTVAPEEVEKLLPKYHLLISFTQFQPRQIPAKTFDYLRFPGKMLVVSEPGSDAANLVTENQFGVVVEPETNALVSLIERILDSRADGFAIREEDRVRRTQFSRESQNAFYVDLSNKLIS